MDKIKDEIVVNHNVRIYTLSAAIRSRTSGFKSSSAGSIPMKLWLFNRLDFISRWDSQEYHRLRQSFAT